MSGKLKILGFGLTALFLALLVRNLSFAELFAAFRQADYSLVAPAAVLTLCGYLLRTVRWQRIIAPVAPLSFPSAFSVLMMGFAANNLLPARLGELVRAYLLRRKTGARKTFGMSTILLERVCDGLTLIAFLGVASLRKPLPELGQQVWEVAGVLFLGAAAGIVVLLAKEEFTTRLVRLLLRPLPKAVGNAVDRAMGAFVAGLHSLKSKRTLALVVVLSVLIWSLEASSYLLMTRAFGVHMARTDQLLAAILLLVVVNLGIMVPSAPGYVGTFHAAAVFALGAFGVTKETSLAIAISSHGMQYAMVTAIGLFFFTRANVAIWRFEKEVSEEPDSEDSTLPAAVQ